MKTFIVTLAVFFICLLQGLMGSKVESSSSATDKGYYSCGSIGFSPCRRGYFNRFGSSYYGYPYGFGYRGCQRSCYVRSRGICC